MLYDRFLDGAKISRQDLVRVKRLILGKAALGMVQDGVPNEKNGKIFEFFEFFENVICFDF